MSPSDPITPAPKRFNGRAVLIATIVVAVLAIALAGFLLFRQLADTADSTTDTNQVVITSDGFTPSTIRLTAGDQVTWINNDNKQRGLIADQQKIADLTTAELLQPSDTFTYTFEEPGTYTYRDSAFPDTVRGIVIVE